MSRRQPPKRTREDWRQEVYRSRLLTDGVRVLLVLLADCMNEHRQVSRPRTSIATALGITERRVTERMALAVEAGFLSRVARGYEGHTAVYEGVFPDPVGTETAHPQRGTQPSPLSGTENAYPLHAQVGTETPYPSNHPRPSAQRAVREPLKPRSDATASSPLSARDADGANDKGRVRPSAGEDLAAVLVAEPVELPTASHLVSLHLHPTQVGRCVTCSARSGRRAPGDQHAYCASCLDATATTRGAVLARCM